MRKKSKTYYALSSPPGRSATATIRISGDESIVSLAKLTNTKPNKFIHGKTVVCDIYNSNKGLIDTVVAVYYRAPRSYTGEDLVEIHTHGNPLIVRAVFNELSNYGLRVAEPGEFTKTAYLNNKIDLVQAESVFSLINAQTERGVSISINNTSGSLSSHLNNLRTSLISTLSYIEYELDISDLDNHIKTEKTVEKEINKTKKLIKKLIRSYNKSKILQEGTRVVIVGESNVGKSTLFNSLLGYDRAIVSDKPGTTRDVVDSSVYISNYSIILVDTAGIRNTYEPIEKEGIKKTALEIERADLIYQILDPTKNTTKKTPTYKPKTITIFNKEDLLDKQQKASLIKTNSGAVFLSAKHNTGIKSLKQKTAKIIASNTAQKESLYITSKRQQDLLLGVMEELDSASDSRAKNQLELISIHLQEAIKQFDWLVGKTTADDILNSIFSGFCVGK